MERAKAYDTQTPALTGAANPAKPFGRSDSGGSRIGLVLGGGGARGLAHIGVLKALCSAGIHVDFIAGASMGAVIGGGFAAGFPLKEMEQIALKINLRTVLSWADFIWPRRGLVAGDRVEKYFEQITFGKTFGELNIPATFVATDIDTGEEIRLASGKVARALRASTAVPGIFNPVEKDGRRLVDGSISASVPVAAAFAMGADVVIASDVGSEVDATEKLLRIKSWWNKSKGSQRASYAALSGGFVLKHVEPMLPESISFVAKTLEFCYKNRQERDSGRLPGDGENVRKVITIRPKVSHVKWFQFYKAKECIAAGEQAFNVADSHLLV